MNMSIKDRIKERAEYIRRAKKLGLDRDVMSTILTCFVLQFTLIFVALIIVKPILNKGNGSKDEAGMDSLGYTQDEWSMNESVQVGIAFERMTTSEEVYESLMKSCNEYKSSMDDTEKLSSGVVVDPDEVYIDIDADSNIGSIKSTGHNNLDSESYVMHETGPIYFQDKLLMRYINSLGEMQIVASEAVYKELDKQADDNKTIEANGVDETSVLGESTVRYEISTVGRSELSNIFKEREQNLSNLSIETIKDTSQTITEEQYIDNLSYLFVTALSTSNSEITPDVRRAILRYFTQDGYKTIFDGKKRLMLGEDSGIKINFAVAGKSDNNIRQKNRIFMQVEISDGDAVNVSNIVIKLNNQFKIFDVDII